MSMASILGGAGIVIYPDIKEGPQINIWQRKKREQIVFLDNRIQSCELDIGIWVFTVMTLQ